jgi:hypothetical protein
LGGGGGGGGGSASWNCGKVAEIHYRALEVSSPFWVNGIDRLDLGCDLAS